jgi:hypothetical protein
MHELLLHPLHLGAGEAESEEEASEEEESAEEAGGLERATLTGGDLMRVFLLIAIVVVVSGCAGLGDAAAVAAASGEELAPAARHISGAARGNPGDWFAIGSYVGNAALAGWVAWERRQRSRERKKGKKS